MEEGESLNELHTGVSRLEVASRLAGLETPVNSSAGQGEPLDHYVWDCSST